MYEACHPLNVNLQITELWCSFGVGSFSVKNELLLVESQSVVNFAGCCPVCIYQHFTSFTPWCRKTAWLRALVSRARKIYSNRDLLYDDIQNIRKSASRNGFPQWLNDKLIRIFTPKTSTNHKINNTWTTFWQSGYNYILSETEKPRLSILAREKTQD